MINPGNILIATPQVIGDIDFHRAVVLIVDSNKGNITGHIINKKHRFFIVFFCILVKGYILYGI